LLVPVELGPDGLPTDPAAFASSLAQRLNDLVRDPDRARAMGTLGRERVLERFTWSAVAQRTLDLYRLALEASPGITASSP
jgi:starch synthase